MSNRPYWILDRKQIECLASAPRAEILDWLCSSGPQSISDLARALNRSAPSLYHHIELMREAGLVREAGRRPVYRKSEKLYSVPSRRMRLKRALVEGEHDDLMQTIVTALTRQFDKDFRNGLANGRARRSGRYRDLGYFRFVGRPSKQGLARINEHLEAIAEILWADQDADASAIAFGWVMAPADGVSEGR